jgi:hypothetical protein
MAAKVMRSEFERGRRAAVLLVARLIRVTEWHPKTKKRLRCLVSLASSLRIDE